MMQQVDFTGSLAKLGADTFEPLDRDQAMTWYWEANEVIAEGKKDIRIDRIMALATGRFWRTLFGLERYFDPLKGVVIERKGRYPKKYGLKDREEMSIKNLAEAPEADIDYVWFIDLARFVFGIFETIAELATGEEFDSMDVMGHVEQKYRLTNEKIVLELLPEPHRQMDELRQSAAKVWRGVMAVKYLKNNPSLAEKVKKDATFQILVNMYLEEHEAEIRSEHS